MYRLHRGIASRTRMTMAMAFRRWITWTSLGLATLYCHQVMANDRTRSSYQLRRTRLLKERSAPRNLQMEELVEDHEIEGWQYHFSQASSIKDATQQPCGTNGSSWSPTGFPSMAPSMVPTHSLAPSALPSNLPSISPTLSPTFQPSMRPTISPSTQPSSTPSLSPTLSPTHIPSFVPSYSPTFSHSPTTPLTPSPFPHQESTTDDNQQVNSCTHRPPEDAGILQDQALAFQYNLYAALEADFNEEVRNMELALHSSLSQQFLSCNYTTNEVFYVVSINAAPQDSFNSSICLAPSNDPLPSKPSKCALVTSQLTMTTFFPQRRMLQISNVTSSKILEVTGNFLESSMNSGTYETDTIVQVSFQGFLTGNRTLPPDTAPSGIRGNDDNNSKEDDGSSLSVTKSRLALGGALVGLAALVVALSLFVINHHRERQQEAYLKHLEEDFQNGDDDKDDNDHPNDDDYHDDEDPGSLGDWRVRLVIDDSDFNISGDTSSLSEVSRDLVAIQPYGRDFHHCQSATCPICQKRRIDPLFIQIQSMDRERLRAVASIRDSYRAPDTVDL